MSTPVSSSDQPLSALFDLLVAGRDIARVYAAAGFPNGDTYAGMAIWVVALHEENERLRESSVTVCGGNHAVTHLKSEGCPYCENERLTLENERLVEDCRAWRAKFDPYPASNHPRGKDEG